MIVFGMHRRAGILSRALAGHRAKVDARRLRSVRRYRQHLDTLAAAVGAAQHPQHRA